ncbi:hypothetical protein AB0K60_23980 [Thermopolyspora sp. NPDC052614]|uniref:hypothetical protein n=1 Tax=Thermopolyspora sp. NPDC052614 TaxID=3155682 RepID=UPI00341819F3
MGPRRARSGGAAGVLRAALWRWPIRLDGAVSRSVGPVGGVEQKAIGAEAVGSGLLIAPHEEIGGARQAKTLDLAAHGIETPDQALALLSGEA